MSEASAYDVHRTEAIHLRGSELEHQITSRFPRIQATMEAVMFTAQAVVTASLAGPIQKGPANVLTRKISEACWIR